MRPPKRKSAGVGEKIKVAVRVRPRDRGDGPASDTLAVRGQAIETADSSVGSYTYDFAFGQDAKQTEIYQAVVAPLVATWVDGYNACVFAYGQTGSGKTYTMLGPDGGKIGGLDGVIPQVAEQIFATIAREEKEFATLFAGACQSQYQVRGSYVEVYNNDVRDLLAKDSEPQAMQVKETADGDVFVDGCVEMSLKTTKDVIKLIRQGADRRKTGRTNMNEHSSRSHAVLKLILEHRWRQAGDAERQFRCKVSQFNLVDLAGSERSKRTGNKDAAFRESVSINTGLLALGNVLAALSGDPRRGRAHVPYRDATLTRLLQSSLGGDSRTVMIACVSPSPSNADETYGTLRYAHGTRSISIAPQQHVALLEEEAGALDNDVEDPEAFLNRRCEWIDTPHHGEVYSRCVGDPSDPLILFVHGSGPANSSSWWNGLIHELAVTSPTSYYMVAIDCPGYGLSPGDKQTIRSTPGAFLADVVHALGCAKAYAICGSSQGSCSAFNAVLERPGITDYIIVMDPVGHDVFRYKNIKQPALLIFDTEDAGHPVKVGRWMRDALPAPHYYEFSASAQPYWHVDNMASKMMEMFASYATQARRALGGGLSSGMTRLAGGLVKWCEAGGSGRATKQISPEGPLSPPSAFIAELQAENEAASKALDSRGAAASADEWIVTADPRKGRVYYCNPRTGETMWNPPRNANLIYDPALKKGDGVSAAAAAEGGGGAAVEDLFAEEGDGQANTETDEQRAGRLAEEAAQTECHFCEDLLWEPVRFTHCRHAVCGMCHKRCLVKYSKECPVCRGPAATEGGADASANHHAAVVGQVSAERVAERNERQDREEQVRAGSSRLILAYGNNAQGSGGDQYNITAFLKLAKAEKGAKSAVQLSGVKVKMAEFNINPRYPKSAVKVTDAPFTLSRRMALKFSCHITARWSDPTLPPVLMPYYVQHEPVTTRYIALVVGPGASGKSKNALRAEGKFPEVYA